MPRSPPHLARVHFVLFKPEMIHDESTLGTVHFTLSQQYYGFTELDANVCITENDIYWGTGVQHWLKRNMPPPHTHTQQNGLYSVPQNVCIRRNKLRNLLSITSFFTVSFFPIDSRHKKLCANLTLVTWLWWWLVGGEVGYAVCLSPKQC